jgi:hypothetical protein
LKSDMATTATAMRRVLGLDLERRQEISAWDKTLRRLIDHADALGILVMVNGVVGNNIYRRLPREVRGFTLADARAPSGVHQRRGFPRRRVHPGHALADIWLGQSALSDVTPIAGSEHEVERWCGAVGRRAARCAAGGVSVGRVIARGAKLICNAHAGTTVTAFQCCRGGEAAAPWQRLTQP